MASPTVLRLISMPDEDSRECPSQGVSEVEREDSLQIDERGQGPFQTNYVLHYRQKTWFHESRMAGIRRHQDKAFCERRDANSFDSDDESVVSCRSQVKPRSIKPERQVSVVAETSVMKTTWDYSGKGTTGGSKRKTPSPAMGVEPAPVSLRRDDDMETEDSLGTEEKLGGSDDNSSPPSSRRVSLSPVSRRLSLQFDSISFFTPMRVAKRRKVSDTSIHS